MTASSEREKARVGLEGLLGSMLGKKMPKTFSLMTMMQTEKAVTLRKRQKETMQYTKSNLPLKSQLQQIRSCDYPNILPRLCTRSPPKAMMAVIGMMNMTAPATRKAMRMKERTSVVLLRVWVMVGMLWWKRKEKTRLEKMSPKQPMLKSAFPLGGVNYILKSFWKMMMTAPRIISTTEMNLTPIVTTWMGLVLEMLRKEKSAPERKKRVSQNSKVSRSSTPVKSRERVLPVMMHLEMETPRRQTEMARAGNIFHRSPQRKRNCSMWSQLSKLFCSSAPSSSSEIIESL